MSNDKWIMKPFKERDVRLSMSEEEFQKQGAEKKKIIEGATQRTEKIVKESDKRWESFEKTFKEGQNLS